MAALWAARKPCATRALSRARRSAAVYGRPRVSVPGKGPAVGNGAAANHGIRARDTTRRTRVRSTNAARRQKGRRYAAWTRTASAMNVPRTPSVRR